MNCTSADLASAAPGRGTIQDAMNLIPYLRDLGVNCVELMPMAEYEGAANWGYTTSHYMAVEYAGGGRDQFKYFVRECHRNGIAVLLDVVYNHYTFDSERAEWAYDSNAPENNIYYWYEGRASDYPNATRPERRLPRQRFERLGAALLVGDGAADVHLQRRGAGQRVPLRRVPGRPDPGDPPRQRPTRRRPFGRLCQPVRPEAAPRMVEHAAADPAERLSHRRGPHRMAGGVPADGSRRPRLRRHLVRRLLPPPDRRRARRPQPGAADPPRRLGWQRASQDALVRRYAGRQLGSPGDLSRIARRGGQCRGLGDGPSSSPSMPRR